MLRWLAMAAMVLLATRAAVADITIGSPVAPAPASPAGTGLNVDYYMTGGSVESIANAQSIIASNTPTATFTSTSIDYPNNTSTFVQGYGVTGDATPQAGYTADDSTTLAGFLGSDSSSLSPSTAGSNTLAGSVFNFTGYLDVTTTGPVTFNLGSDDGSQLWINGISVIDNGGDHRFSPASQTVDFTATGLYQIQLIYFENDGQTAVALTSDMGGTNQYVSTPIFYQGLPSNNPVTTPEPSTFALVGLGALAFAGYGYRRRRPT